MMLTELNTLSPRQTFEDNMRPAQLLLRVYRLLDSNDQIVSDAINHTCLALDELVTARLDELLALSEN